MASFKKLDSGRWQAQVYKAGKRSAKTFDTKIEAKDWAAATTTEFKNDTAKPFADHTFGMLLDKYAREVSTKKRGSRWEIIRIEKFKRDPIAQKKLDELQPADFSYWRDEKLKTLSGSSVAREMQLMSHALRVAVREWGMLPENPMEHIAKPRKNPPRDRRITDEEIEAIKLVASYDTKSAPVTVQQKVVHGFLFAIETAMRAGEIVGLHWHNVSLGSRVATLCETKNGTVRQVSLSKEAIRLLELLPQDEGSCFGLHGRQLDSVFRKLRDRAGIENLHFHDTRHEAITRLARKLDVLDLARMVGHKNISMLQVYYNPSAEDIARRLD